MKVGIIGSGFVGATAAYAIVMRGVAREIVLVDLDTRRAQAEADDIMHAVPFAHPAEVRAGGYAELRGSKLVVLTAGVNQKPGESRLELLERNAAIFRTIVPELLEHAPEAVMLVATNPVDAMTHLVLGLARALGHPEARILGSGTTLDTARFRSILGRRIGIDAQHIHAYVLGEHGDSEVFNWSQVSVSGIPLAAFSCDACPGSVGAEDRAGIERSVRGAANQIIEGKHATYYGIGSALARIAEVILQDQRAVLTVCGPLPRLPGFEDIEGLTLSLPNLVGGSGIMSTFAPSLDAGERAALLSSGAVIRTAVEGLLEGQIAR
ncbi:MAG TPA: L-lactate dehydrogenase [Rectinemataceae bacterium]|nr:L-lactate dehydrogenase [Rectinemataceae bacterium]